MYNLLTYTYLLLPLSVLITRLKWRSVDNLLLGLYGLIAFVFLYFDISNLPPKYQAIYLYLYTSVEYAFFSTFLYRNIANTKVKILIIALSVCFFLFQIFYYFNAPIKRLDSIPIGVETILLFIYIFYFLYETFKSPKTQYLYNYHFFWIAIGILIYLGSSFFLYILADHIKQEEIDKYWDLTYIAEIIKNLFFVLGIFLFRKRELRHKFSAGNDIPYLDMN